VELIPAIDLRGGRCVRLLQGRFDAETDYGGDPLQLLGRYRALGAAWLHVVDLDGARDGIASNLALIGGLAAAMPGGLQVGGGVRTVDAAAALFSLGVGRVVVGSLAVTQPGVVRGWLERYGAERIVLALDVRLDAAGHPLLVSHGWQRSVATSLWDLLSDATDGYAASGLRHVLCTDVECDGTLAGPNVGLYEEAVRNFPEIAWQASGGIRNAVDLQVLRASGVAAAVSGRALLEHRLLDEELSPYLPGA
jgi:phosphoribosylformimino-5-aminoimidazole carboxamide ribotide isomerase